MRGKSENTRMTPAEHYDSRDAPLVSARQTTVNGRILLPMCCLRHQMNGQGRSQMQVQPSCPRHAAQTALQIPAHGFLQRHQICRSRQPCNTHAMPSQNRRMSMCMQGLSEGQLAVLLPVQVRYVACSLTTNDKCNRCYASHELCISARVMLTSSTEH